MTLNRADARARGGGRKGDRLPSVHGDDGEALDVSETTVRTRRTILMAENSQVG